MKAKKKNYGNGFVFPNKIESIILFLLKKHRKKFLFNQILGKYQIDFLLNNSKIIIEVNGDFWHCNPKQYEATYFHKTYKKFAKSIWNKDKKKILELKKLGYSVIVIWENDIRRNLQKIEKVIKKL